MTKNRGRPKKKPQDRKSAQISIRLTRDLRKALAKAVKQSGQTISAEVEHRLSESLLNRPHEKPVKELGGERMYALLRMVADAMRKGGETALMYSAPEKLAAVDSWMDDSYAYDQSVQVALHVLDTAKPVGDPSPPTVEPLVVVSDSTIPPHILEQMNQIRSHVGQHAANAEIERVAEALPLFSANMPSNEVRARLIAHDLGKTHGRLKPPEKRK
jgi:hypothetical protein